MAVLCRAGAVDSASLTLSAEEKAWIAGHPVVRVGYDPAFPPFCFRDAAGVAHGIDADLLADLGRMVGVRFELSTGATWAEVYSRARRREFDVLSSTADVPERRPYFVFTRPYVKFAVTIVTRTDGPFAVTEGDLKNMRVAAARDYAPTLAFRRAYPAIRIVEFDNIGQAMQAVANSNADAVVTNLANASYIIKTSGLTNLKIAGVIPEVFEERMAVRSDWPVLAGILDRAIAAIPPEDMAAILDRWVKVDYSPVVRWDVVRRWAILGVLFALTVLALIGWRNAGLATELEKRRAVQQELERANARLNAANVELGQRHDEKAELMRVAAHDLRGPLSAIMLSAEALRDDPSSELIDSILGSSQRMAQLIDDLLQAHAIEEGKRAFRQDRVGTVDVVRAAASTFLAAARRKQISIDATGLAPVDDVCGDAAALRQVFENLLSNAVKFSPPGRAIRLITSPWSDQVRIEVQDEGPGVPENERERIFTKYTRGSARPTAGEKSTGLGLAIVREIVAASNGRVWCENAAGCGAVFVVLLPRYRAPV